MEESRQNWVFKDATWEDERSKSEINIIKTLCLREHEGREASLKLHAYPLFYGVEHIFRQFCVTKDLHSLVFLLLLFLNPKQGKMALFTESTYSRDHCPISCFGKRDQNSTCSHQRWFRARTGPGVSVVRPSRGSHAGAGTEPSPSSRSPGGCPCGWAEGRRLDQAYLRESACHWWHVPFTKLECWGV